jgi:hypothetical protein
MKFAKALLMHKAAAQNMARSLWTQPAVFFTTRPGLVIYLDNVTHIQSAQAQVSEFPVIVSGKNVKQFQYDNVAPSPWTWQITGYIPGNSSIEQTSDYTPIVTANTEYLKHAFETGERLIFKDVDNRTYKNCVIESLSIETKAEVKNKRPFSMTLKQIVEISGNTSTLSIVQENSTPVGEQTMDNVVTTPVSVNSIGYDKGVQLGWIK